jgi:hypothetical protein
MSEQRDLSGRAFIGPQNAGNGAAATSHGVAGHIYGGYWTPDKQG